MTTMLPYNWKPRRSGPILANYLKQREQDHATVLGDIAHGAAAVNEDIDIRVRTLAENLLAHVQQNQREIDCYIDKCDTIEGPLTVGSRNKALKDIRKQISQRLEDMATFKREALSLERERADKLRILLRGHFQRLVTVGHSTPKDLIHKFDEQIYDINQQLLSNSKAYTELEASLQNQADQSFLRARSSLNQLCLGIKMAYRARSALIWCKDEKISRQRSHSVVDRHRSVDEHLVDILDDIGEFDSIISRVVMAYRTAVKNVFTGFAGELSQLHKDLGNNLDFRGPYQIQEIKFLDFQRLLEQPLQRLSNILTTKNPTNKSMLEITGADLITMQKSVWSLGERLRETCSVLNSAGHLWDDHILRSALAQKLTIAAVEDLLTNNDAVELANEIPFSIVLEQLRCAPDEDKLKQQFEAIILMLSKTTDMYLQHSEAELGRLEEFMKFPTVMADTLLAEFSLFLEKYPRAIPLQASISTTCELAPETMQMSPSVVSSEMPLPRAIYQTELQEIALKNWRNGFLESFEANMSLVPEELTKQARLWVEERSAYIHMRYSLKMVSHAIRLERVTAAQETRLKEIRHHNARLESHLNAIIKLVDRLPVEASEFASLDAPMLYPICEWIERLNVNIQNTLRQDPLDPEVKKMKMKSYAPRLAKHRQLFEESLDLPMEEFKRQLEHRIQEARISNVRFISQIKLFSEGGQYAAQEATKTCNALTKAADSLESCLHKTLDILNQRRTQLLALADNQILPLQRVVEITVKTKSTTRTYGQKKTGKKK